MPGFPVTALRSVDLTVPDLPAAIAFYTGPWALALVEATPTTAILRATGADHHVLVLHQGAAPAIRSITFRVQPGALPTLSAKAAGAGATILHPPAPVDWPGGGDGLVVIDPQGRTLRFVDNDARRPPDPPIRDRPERLSHVNVNSQDTDAAHTFFQTALGFRLSDRSKLMAFIRCNTDHHSLVITEADTNGLNHIAFQIPTLEGLMRGAGRLIDHGTPIAWGIGRHGPGNNIFAYFVDPFGIVVEYTAELLQIDDSYVPRGPQDWTWPPGRTDHWGIAPPKSETVKKAQLAIQFAPRDFTRPQTIRRRHHRFRPHRRRPRRPFGPSRP